MFVIAVAAACVVAGSATGDPSIASKQAQARQVMGQIQQIDASMEHAVEAYDAATAKLQGIERDLRVNRAALRVARANLAEAQAALSQRMVAIYTSAEDTSTLAVVLGSTSLEDLVNRIETIQSVTQQDSDVIDQVASYKHAVAAHSKALERARSAQTQIVSERAAEKARIHAQLAQRQALLVSIKGEIAHLQAMENARQLALAREARARVAVQQQQQADAASQAVVGATAATPDATVAPPSQYGGVVGIAMSQLGKPYVWGAAGPNAFDCSGLVAWAYAQVGVSLPHYTGAQWGAGVPVAKSDLQPGDLVFFNGLGHVGIYIGGGQFVHAPHTGDVVKISSLSESWYASTYDGARRITG